ncbi:MAG: hypothetical protein KKA67_09625, partial [Spirochaetes bacterium]|nr:hypothetical protein [Spirochaetota bacterium]
MRPGAAAALIALAVAASVFAVPCGADPGAGLTDWPGSSFLVSSVLEAELTAPAPWAPGAVGASPGAGVRAAIGVEGLRPLGGLGA